MFPEAPLPDACFLFVLLARIGVAVVRREAAAEGAFQGADSHGVVVVVFWELQDGVEVFGQDGDGDGFVGVAASGFLPCCAKCGDVAGEPVAAAVLQDGGDEVGAAFGVVATVVWHGVSGADGGFVVGKPTAQFKYVLHGGASPTLRGRRDRFACCRFFMVGQAPPYAVVAIGSRAAGFSWWGKPHPTWSSR